MPRASAVAHQQGLYAASMQQLHAALAELQPPMHDNAFSCKFLRCIANAKDFNKAGEIHCRAFIRAYPSLTRWAFVSTSQAASVEIRKLPKTHPKTWRNSDRVISVALWGIIGDETTPMTLP